jgi:hypothetical protein
MARNDNMFLDQAQYQPSQGGIWKAAARSEWVCLVGNTYAAGQKFLTAQI